MKIALISDTHYGRGMTSKESLLQVFQDMAEEGPDLVIHAGDWSGTAAFPESVRQTMLALRKYLPNTPVLATTGNHDYWVMKTNRMTEKWQEHQQKKGRQVGRDLGVSWLDEYPGGFVFGDTRIVGTMTWYGATLPLTNDCHWIPGGREPLELHRRIRNEQYDIWSKICSGLREAEKSGRCDLLVVTHHPLVYPEAPVGGREHGGPEHWADELEEAHGRQPLAYLNGHFHQRWNGEKDGEGRKRYESGSDYGIPRYIMVNV